MIFGSSQRRILLAALGFIALAVPSIAGEVKSNPKAVLELFTSQGCNSCPPADALLKSLDEKPDLITLAYHVDYWDYIGWADTFGAKANTDRQRAYAASWQSNTIYTPELVINGANAFVGSHKPEVEGAVASASLPIPVALKADGDMLDVSIDGKPGEHESGVWLVTFINNADVTVSRGENAGKKLSYSQVVTGRHILGMWDPATGAHLRLPLDEVLTGPSNGAVILVQSERDGLPGPIMGAASFVR
jgi:hypothetical protein